MALLPRHWIALFATAVNFVIQTSTPSGQYWTQLKQRITGAMFAGAPSWFSSRHEGATTAGPVAAISSALIPYVSDDESVADATPPGIQYPHHHQPHQRIAEPGYAAKCVSMWSLLSWLLFSL